MLEDEPRLAHSGRLAKSSTTLEGIKSGGSAFTTVKVSFQSRQTS